VLEVFPFEGEALRINGHHEVLARPSENQHFVLGIGADGLEYLAKCPMIFDAQLN